MLELRRVWWVLIVTSASIVRSKVASTHVAPATDSAVIIDTVVLDPAAPTIVLRNVGSSAVNLTGWRLTNNRRYGDPRNDVVFGWGPCAEFAALGPADALFLRRRPGSRPCRFTFDLTASNELVLLDGEASEVAVFAWNETGVESSLKRAPHDTHTFGLPLDGSVVEVMRSRSVFGTFLKALEAANLSKLLTSATDPSYTFSEATDSTHSGASRRPWWYRLGHHTPAHHPPPPPPPPAPPIGLSQAGPFTVFAPTDQAFEDLLAVLGGFGEPLPLEALLSLPALPSILLFHIMPEELTTDRVTNSTFYMTALGVDLLAFKPAHKGAAHIALSDACVDKPTPDEFSCAAQRAFGVCDQAFMVSPMAAQWSGGFCQRTCARCSCGPLSGIECAKVELPDLLARNGVVHGISRVLMPSPRFTKDGVAGIAPH